MPLKRVSPKEWEKRGIPLNRSSISFPLSKKSKTVKTFVTWDQVHQCTEFLAKLIEHQKYDAIIGVQRGGLIPAVLLSHKLNMPMHTIQFSLRDLKQVGNIDLPKKGRYLVVDDINDTGETFSQLQEKFNQAGLTVKYAVLHNNVPSKFTVDHYALEIDKSKDPAWIVYPWESK